MKIKFRCVPELYGHIPEPIMTRSAPPHWLEEVPETIQSEALGGETAETFKTDPVFMRSYSLGLLFRLPCDLKIVEGEVSWDWEKPVAPKLRQVRSPISVYVPEQATGMQLGLKAQDFPLKFNNFWSIEAPRTVSLLFTHPLNREELPFRTLSGVVGYEQLKTGAFHFPAIWKQEQFEGIIPALTPIAQAFFFEPETLELDVGPMNKAEVNALQEKQHHPEK